MNKRCSAVLLNKLPLKEKDLTSFTISCQVLEKHKEAEDLAANHSSRLENSHMEVLTEREIADKFFDEHLMARKSKSNNDEPWYADFVNYIVGKAADRVVSPTPGFAITIPETANEFAIKDTENEAVRLMMFPLSLTGEAKTWLDELNEGTIETWDELRTAFISQFFPPALFDRLLGEIRAFSQHENESLTDAWLRMKEMLRNCHGHNLSKGNIIKNFYHGLNEITQEVLNAAASGIFLYKTPNQAYQLLEDKVLLKLDWAKNQKTKSSLKKTVAFADKGSSNSDTNKIMARMGAMTLKMDAQYKELQTHSKKTKPNLDEDDIPMSR
ncbi:reverse transcriptase domain-containing protein, partial [Tanacetum coccineum]